MCCINAEALCNQFLQVVTVFCSFSTQLTLNNPVDCIWSHRTQIRKILCRPRNSFNDVSEKDSLQHPNLLGHHFLVTFWPDNGQQTLPCKVYGNLPGAISARRSNSCSSFPLISRADTLTENLAPVLERWPSISWYSQDIHVGMIPNSALEWSLPIRLWVLPTERMYPYLSIYLSISKMYS